MRRQFRLPSEDESYLDAVGLAWETLSEGGSKWLLIHEAPVPGGYNANHVIEAYLIDPNYPDTQIDMVYFHPGLSRSDGKSIGAAECLIPLDGKTFQRWSRHRTPANQWRRGVDDISTHRTLVQHWLEREFTIR